MMKSVSVVDLTSDTDDDYAGASPRHQPILPLAVHSSTVHRLGPVKMEEVDNEDEDNAGDQCEMKNRGHEMKKNEHLPQNRAPAAAATITQHSQANDEDADFDHDDTTNSNSEDEGDTTPQTTGVDGKGLWRSWKRNFKNSLLALLDLVDNSLDASIPKIADETNTDFVGRVHIFPDVYQSRTTGLCMINNSTRPICPLVEVLTVYNSSKIDSGAGDIGENGVGLKQGCATLSDLSFIFSKNGGNGKLELGIIAESLQKKEGCFLPAFQFSNAMINGESNLPTQMLTIFSQTKHQEVAKCIAQYGAANSENEPNLIAGIDRLCRHFDRICYNFYNNDYVFSVVLDNITHRVSGKNDITSELDDSDSDGYGNEARCSRVSELVAELKKEIPLTYLHLPENFDFCIEGFPMSFKYWTERLVELASFTVKVGKILPWHKTIKEGDPDAYDVRVLIGFDRLRVAMKEARKEASLYIYSRQSGRLIKFEPDGRHVLGLNASGTDYCSGLTIIIDDGGGNLPLNPTKQDIAFGEESFGEIHKQNLFKWVGAVTHFYYNYQLAKFGKKTLLTNEIKKFQKSALPAMVASCDTAVLSTFDVVFKNHRGNIRADQGTVLGRTGRDTYFRLNAPQVAPSESLSQNGRKRKKADRLVEPNPQNAGGRDRRPRKKLAEAQMTPQQAPPASSASRSKRNASQQKMTADDAPYRPSFLNDICPMNNDETSPQYTPPNNNEDGVNYKAMYEESQREVEELKKKLEKEKELRIQTEKQSKRIISVLEKRVDNLRKPSALEL